MFGDRLRIALRKANITQKNLANQLGVSRQSVVNWLNGRNEPNKELLPELAAKLSVDEGWLKGITPAVPGTPVVAVEDPPQDSLVFVQEYELSFGCGAGKDAPAWVEIATGGAAYNRSFFQRRGISPDNCRRVQAEGDSMEPVICDGDHVLFVQMRDGEAIRDGRVYALSYGGALRIKRLYQRANGDIVIHSDNPKYEDETVPACDVDETIRVYGLVIERSGTI